MRITVETQVEPTPRVLQCRGLFDLSEETFSRVVWDCSLTLHKQRPWQIGLITGPSGCGKSTVARNIFPLNPALQGGGHIWTDTLPPWHPDRSVLDAFPEGLSVKDITLLLSSVGFSSPPAWLRPYRVLSTGQRFRCDLALLLAHLTPDDVGVYDEFTSVVDRTVAKVGSSALAKTVRQRNLRFVAVTCHEDVLDWLQPDWIYQPATDTLTWRSLQRRPTLDIEIVRAAPSAWPLFRPHHYLSHALSSSATCFLALHDNKPIAFSAWVNALTSRGGKREHRTVVLPDWQGVGVGMALSATVASLWKAIGYRASSTTTHPAFINARKRSPLWQMIRSPSLAGGTSKFKHANTRLTAGFEYVGPPMDLATAQRMLA